MGCPFNQVAVTLNEKILRTSQSERAVSLNLLNDIP